MRAIVVDRWMDPSELRVTDFPSPEVGAGMIGIEVRAAGCNFFDILLVQGKYQQKPPFPFIPGAELAGVVREIGAGVTGFAIGDRVMSSLTMGAFAERVALPVQLATKLPDEISFEEAAAMPVVYPTSYAALVYRAAVREGEMVLVTAAAGGVGLAAVEIAKALGARVIAAAGGADKLAIAKAAGADVLVDYGSPDWVAEVNRATGGRGVDVVVENVGGDVFDGVMKCIAWGGRIVIVGFAGGRIPEVKLNRVLLKNISLVGLHWGPHAMSDPEKFFAAPAQLFELYKRGQIAPRVWKTFPLEQAPQALEALASRKTWGKVVIRVTEG